ncbi:Ribonuclease H [Arachis hypogaea]|nr:Ribonuclease H [Arachis hypogaea]
MSTEAGRFPFYAVCKGRVPGVYRTWKECEQQVNGFRNCEYRGFRDLDEALAWLRSAAAPSTRQPGNAVQSVSRRPCRLLEGAFCSLPSSQQGCSGVVAANS